MAEEHKTKFDAYRVRYLSGGDANPEIDCLYRGVVVGRLFFHEGDGALQPNEIVQETNGAVIRLHFRLSQLPHLVDLLREEKPLYLSFSESSLVGAVMTGVEPVGEGEAYLSR